jgi:predicted nucleotidyltransferase
MDNKLKITCFLGKNHPKGFTMHDLSKKLSIPYATFHREAQKMNGLVNIDSIGKSKVMTLNLAHPTVRSYLSIASNEEKEEFLKTNPIIRTIASDAKGEIVVLFGSQAKHQATERSDIDLMIINKKGERTDSFTEQELLYKKKIHPIFIKRSEFIQMLREKHENVGKQTVKGHIVLRNPEAFWTLVLDGLQNRVQERV